VSSNVSPLSYEIELHVSLAVRAGSLSQFQATLSQHAAQFEADKTYTLIVRLRQNVIKTGIRRLSLSYSRISLRDICFKLHLDSEEDAEYIVGKAIRDGVIDGRIVHEKGWMECGGPKGGYGPEVSEVFGRRIAYCLELHNQSVKVKNYLAFVICTNVHDIFLLAGHALSFECSSKRIGSCRGCQRKGERACKRNPGRRGS
jgi:PCI domain